MKQVTKIAWVKISDLDSGAKLIAAYNANGEFLLIRGRLCFYDTKWQTVY